MEKMTWLMHLKATHTTDKRTLGHISTQHSPFFPSRFVLLWVEEFAGYGIGGKKRIVDTPFAKIRHGVLGKGAKYQVSRLFFYSRHHVPLSLILRFLRSFSSAWWNDTNDRKDDLVDTPRLHVKENWRTEKEMG